MPPLFLLGIGKTRKATLIRTYFSLYIGLMYKSVQLHAWNHKFPPRKHLGHYMFLGGQWVFWGASGFSDSLAPRASCCHSPMSRPARANHYWCSIIIIVVKCSGFGSLMLGERSDNLPIDQNTFRVNRREGNYLQKSTTTKNRTKGNWIDPSQIDRYTIDRYTIDRYTTE